MEELKGSIVTNMTEPISEILAYLAAADPATIAMFLPAAVAEREAVIRAQIATMAAYVVTMVAQRKTIAAYEATIAAQAESIAEHLKTEAAQASTIADLEAIDNDPCDEEYPEPDCESAKGPRITLNGRDEDAMYVPGIGYVVISHAGDDLFAMNADGYIDMIDGVHIGEIDHFERSAFVSHNDDTKIRVEFEEYRGYKRLASVTYRFVDDRLISRTHHYGEAGAVTKTVDVLHDGSVETNTPEQNSVQRGRLTTICDCGGVTTIRLQMHPDVVRITCGTRTAFELTTPEGIVNYVMNVDGCTYNGCDWVGELTINGTHYHFRAGQFRKKFTFFVGSDDLDEFI